MATARKDMRKDMAFTIPYGLASTVINAYKTLTPAVRRWLRVSIRRTPAVSLMRPTTFAVR